MDFERITGGVQMGVISVMKERDRENTDNRSRHRPVSNVRVYF